MKRNDSTPWHEHPDGALILKAILKQERRIGSDPDPQQNTEILLRHLHGKIQEWKNEHDNIGAINDRLRSAMLEEARVLSAKLSDVIYALNLPTGSLSYFSTHEIKARMRAQQNAFNSPFDEDYFDQQDISAHLSLAFTEYPEAEIHLDEWLEKLTNPSTLDRLAPKPVVKKVNTEEVIITFVARRIATFLYRRYDRTLPATIERICAIEFPNAQITRDSIRSKLRGFDPLQVGLKDF